MPKVFPILNVGEHGIVTDLPDFQLPPNAWSNGGNVRFFENRAAAVKGYESVLTPSVPPYSIDIVKSGTTAYYIYAGLDHIYTYDETAGHVERTRAAGVTVYTGAANDLWNSCLLHDYHILNNGVDAPQYWQLGAAGDYADLPYDSGNSWTAMTATCKLMASSKYHLMAMDVSLNANRYPRRVWWPEPAEPGSLPSDWDVTDPTNRAGWTDLVGGTGVIQAAEGMSESVIIYTDDLAFRADWVGGSTQWDFNPLDWAQGAASQRSVCSLPGGVHFVVGQGEVYIHNGQSYDPVADEKIKRAIFGDISGTNYKQLFVIPNYRYNEVMIALPTGGATYCDRAYIYNYRRKAWSDRDLPDLVAAAYGLDTDAFATPDLWSDMTATTWEEATWAWAGRGFNPFNRSLVGASPTGSGAIYRLDSTNQAAGSNIECFVERTGLNIGGGDAVITVTGVIPRIKSTGAVDIRVGGQMIPNGPVTWSDPVSFDPSTDQRATFWAGASGRYNAIRVSSTSDIEWELESLLLEYQVRGGS